MSEKIQPWPTDYYILIPSYKAVTPIRALLHALLQIVPRENIFVVDDASEDGTDLLCKELAIAYFAHRTNKGKGRSLADGFLQLIDKGAQWIITMDADGQHVPADLYSFVTLAQDNRSMGIGIGKRHMKFGRMPFMRILSNRLTSKFLSLLTQTPIEDSQCGYRIYSTEFLRALTIQYYRFEMESEVILKAAFLHYPIKFIPVQTLYFETQNSHISHVVDTFRWIRAVVSIYLAEQSKSF